MLEEEKIELSPKIEEFLELVEGVKPSRFLNDLAEVAKIMFLIKDLLLDNVEFYLSFV